MSKTYLRLVAFASTFAVAAGLSSSGCTTSCTELAYQSGITFRVVGTATAFGAQLPVTMRLCVGAECRELTPSQGGQGEPNGDVTVFLGTYVDETATVTIEVKNEQGTSLFTKSSEVPTDPAYADGEGCGETCRSGDATFAPASN